MSEGFLDTQNAARIFFASRQEELLQAEAVVEINRADNKKPKQRVIAISQAKAGSLVMRTVCVLTPQSQGAGGEKKNKKSNKKGGAAAFKIKEEHPISRLGQVKPESSSVLSLQFTGSGCLSVSFESSIQRDLFTAALKKHIRAAAAEQQSDGGYGGGFEEDDGDGGRYDGDGFGGRRSGAFGGGGDENTEISVSSTVTTLQSNVRARRQRERRLERKSAWTHEEEKLLLHEMKAFGVSMSNMSKFDEKVNTSISKANLLISTTIVELDDAWKRAAELTQDLQDDVADAEEAIEHLSQHLVSRRSTIEEIEHACTALQRKKDNLERLSERLGDLHNSVGLSETSEAIIYQLRATLSDAEGVSDYALFTDSAKLRGAKEAISRIHQVLHNGRTLGKQYPINAVSDRLNQFASFGRLLALKAKDFIAATVTEFSETYFTDKYRFSTKNKIRLIPHTEVLQRVQDVGPMLEMLGRVDRRGYDAILRLYCAKMQRVYQKEIKAFFVELRQHFRRVGWHSGEPFIGKAELHVDQLNLLVEAGEVGPSPMRPSVRAQSQLLSNSIGGGGDGNITPRMRSGSFSSNNGGGHVVSVTPGGYSLRSASRGGGGGRDSSPAIDDPYAAGAFSPGVSMQRAPSYHALSATSDELELTLPDLGTRVIRDGAKVDLAMVNKQAAAATSVASAFKARLGGESGGGSIRPDVLFGIALEAVVDIALAEDEALRKGFHVPSVISGILAPATDDVVPPRSKTDAEDGIDSDGEDAATAGHSEKSTGGETSTTTTTPEGENRVHLALHELFCGEMMLMVKRAAPSSGGTSQSASTAVASPVYRDVISTEFAAFLRHLVERSDRTYLVSMLTMVNMLLHEGSKTESSPFVSQMLEHLRAILTSNVHKYTAEQIQSIRDCAASFETGKVPLLNCFSNLPVFLSRMESLHGILTVPSSSSSSAASAVRSGGQQHSHSLQQFVGHVAVLISQLLDHCFEAIDIATAEIPSSSGSGALGAAASSKLGVQLPFTKTAGQMEAKHVAHNYFMLYRHHSFYCCLLATLKPTGTSTMMRTPRSHQPMLSMLGDSNPMDEFGGGPTHSTSYGGGVFEQQRGGQGRYQANPVSEFILELLLAREAESIAKRDRFADLYLSKRIFMVFFGDFATFINRVEELLATYEPLDLVHQKVLSLANVQKMFHALRSVFPEACSKSARKIRFHCTRDLNPESCEEGFHRGFMHATWTRFKTHVMEKLEVAERLIATLPTLESLKPPLRREEALACLSDAVSSTA